MREINGVRWEVKSPIDLGRPGLAGGAHVATASPSYVAVFDRTEDCSWDRRSHILFSDAGHVARNRR